MADAARRRTENVPGPWFVDETCIDCGTCMWMSSAVFEEREGQAAVHRQPDARSLADAQAALVACPTGSIGGPVDIQAALASFPRPLGAGVWHLGFHSRKSFGATPYLVQTGKGLVMVDVPRFHKAVADRLLESGGVTHILLTHRDDVADHEKWADALDAKRVIHADDDEIGAEKRLKGSDGRLAGMRWIHVPGHTRGSVVYVHEKTLFTGDHLAGDAVGDLKAFRRACWYDWREQTGSMARLAGLEVERVLPGHGHPWQGTVADYHAKMERLLGWMRTA